MNIDEEIRQLAREGRKDEAIALLQERTGMDRPHAEAAIKLLMHRASAPQTLFALATGTAILILTILAITWIGLHTIGPIVQAGVDLTFKYVLWPLARVPFGLAALGLVILVVGLPLARRFPHPSRFRGGVMALALALMCASLFPLYIATVQKQFPPDAELPLLIVGLVVLGWIFFGGLSAVLYATMATRDESSNQSGP